MIRLWPGFWFGIGLFLMPLAWAGPQADKVAPLQPPMPPADQPPVPVAKSPVDTFRELLAMSPAERKQALTNRPAEVQKQILAKVREYETLRANERELRLQATELRYYLLPVLNSPSTNRAAQLVHLPEQARKLVIVRLRQWDQLSPEVQKELLDNEAAVRYFTEATGSVPDPKRAPAEVTSARQQKLEASLARWWALSKSDRSKIEQRFHTFFELSADEKSRALESLSVPERNQIQKTLDSFSSLPPPQRLQCIRGFEKFASLPVDERQQFLKNAERWKLMSPEERKKWRDLVTKLAAHPPLPPGVGPAFTMPPLPPANSRSLATNGQ
jgi:hypothetical protein